MTNPVRSAADVATNGDTARILESDLAARATPNGTAAATPNGTARSKQERDALILKHLPLVKAIANRMRSELPLQVTADDMIQEGVLGLFDAAAKYRPEKKVPFRLYAKHRIRGSILDSLRQEDWASRGMRGRSNVIEALTRKLAQELQHAPTDRQCAQEMGVTEDRFRRMTAELHDAGLGGAEWSEHGVHRGYDEENFPELSKEDRPDQVYAGAELRSILGRAISTLPPRYLRVLTRYYRDGLTMKQIASELGVNESRISQMHKRALEWCGTALREAGYSFETLSG